MTAAQKMKGAKEEGASPPISASCGLAVFLGALGPSGEKPGREKGEGEREGKRGTCFYRQSGAVCACQGQNCWLFPGLTFYREEESHPTCMISS